MPLLTPEEAAAELAISTKTLQRLTRSGALAYINIGLGTEREARRYDREDIEAFIRESKVRMHPRPNAQSNRKPATLPPHKVYDIKKLRDDIKSSKNIT